MSERHPYLREAIRILAPLVILGLGAAGLGALWSMKQPPEPVTPEVKLLLVETRPVEVHGEGLEIVTDGIVVPARDVTIATQVAGKVVYKSEACEAGKYVSEGTVLFKIDAEDYRLEVERLTKERAQADANLQEVDLELENTESLIELSAEELRIQQRELQRQLQLRGPAVSESALDQARRAELAARNALLTLENQKRLLQSRRNTTEISRQLVEVRLEKASLDFARTEVKAPVSGVVVEEMVEEDSFVPLGAAMAKIEDTSAVEVRCSLQMDELYWLWRQPRPESDTPYRSTAFSPAPPAPGDASEAIPPPAPGQAAYQIPHAEVTVTYEIGGRHHHWEGWLDRFEGIGVDERTRTIPCRVVVPEPRKVKREDAQGAVSLEAGPRALIRGMFVKLRIHAQPDAPLVRIPEEAIRPGGKVFVVRNLQPNTAQTVDDVADEAGSVEIWSEGVMFEEKVQVAAVMNGMAIIDAGAFHLQAGERVVVTPVAMDNADDLRMIPPEGIVVREVTQR
jgi:multidrug efflux pump subunit AcrA (membrane-fusion protein)